MRNRYRHLVTSILVLAIAVLLSAQTSRAQITIATNMFQPDIGSSVNYVGLGGVDATVWDNAAAGSGQIDWTFPPFSTTSPFQNEVVDIAGVPEADSFPAATFVLYADDLGATTWSFYQSEPSTYRFLGTVVDQGLGGDLIVTAYDNPVVHYDFPIDYNDTWEATNMYTIQSSPSVYSETFDTAFYSVDAYGTATYNGNSKDCLRISVLNRVTTITYVNNVPFQTTVIVNERIEFVAAGWDVLLSLVKTTISGSTFYTGSASGSFADSPTDVSEREGELLPDQFELAQNYPNPFNPSTTIDFNLPQASDVTISVHNVLGQLVTTLTDHALSAGAYSVAWDGRDHSGNPAASGVYFYRLTAGDVNLTRKMLLVK